MNSYAVTEIAGYRQAEYLATARRARQAREAHRVRAAVMRRSRTRAGQRSATSLRTRFA